MRPPAPPTTDEVPPLIKVPARTAVEVARGADLDAAALVLLRPGQTPRAFLDLLLAHQRFTDAIKFLAFALPRREAIWWACLCLRHAIVPAPPPLDTALRVVVRWVLHPEEPERQQASRLIKGDFPRDYLLRAVAWTGGSLTPAPLPAVPPSPVLTPRAVNGALLLAATSGPPDAIDSRLRHFLVLGIGVARGKFLWPQRPPPVRRVPSTRRLLS